jgi:hypothetical protein
MKRIAALLAGVWFAGSAPSILAQYPGWQQEGSIFILTTPEGANLPASEVEKDFPLLVRLHKDFFDFSQAKPNGEDIRFSAQGQPLAYQIDEWDAARGTASLWVRIPRILGNARQEIRMHWGKADAVSESSGSAVFNESNGYLSVWHMGTPIRDEVGTLASVDKGTTPAVGRIGPARHLAGGQGIFGGERITNYPTGASTHTSEAWFRPDKPNGTVLGWGNEQAQGKVVMQFRSPPHVGMDCYFSDANVASKSRLPMAEWIHAVHTYQNGEARLYLNGVLEGISKNQGGPLNLKTPARLWLGGWYHNYSFAGDLDEVRISKVVRSADWVRLEFENQNPLQTLVGPVVQKGDAFSVSASQITVAEGKSATVTARAGGAQKLYWLVKRDGQERVAAVDRLAFTFEAGRVVGDQSAHLQFQAVYAEGVRTKDIAVAIKEDIEEPVFTLKAPAEWDGRETVEVTPVVANLAAMQAKGVGDLHYAWSVSGLATIKEVRPDRLILKRAQNSGRLEVALALNNGGAATTRTIPIRVHEPKTDPWVPRVPARDERPEDNQFFARDDKNEGTLYCNGTLPEAAESVFLRVYAEDKLVSEQSRGLSPDRAYALMAKLKPGLIKYRLEFGSKTGGAEKILHTATNLVCGDAYLIDGQSNALATDTGEKSPPETSDWIRSYGSPKGNGTGERANLWCNPVWKAQKGELAELGYWGMELAKRLVESQRIPVCIVNGAVGGTRIDQHQRNPANPEDLSTIYGRLLWRVRQAKLTHGIRAILWHQGENDQGADGPTGGYGWETYRQYFIEMAAGWKEDYPNLQHYYLFQIWPRACAMGGNGSDNMLREVQRTLPSDFSKMGIMSTLGIKPPGGCHYPLAGWAEFARLIQPLLERDNYGKVFAESITPPNLIRAAFTTDQRDGIALEFDQPVIWSETLDGQFHLEGGKEKIIAGSVAGNVLTLKLSAPSNAQRLTYLDSQAWSPTNLLRGANGIAALTFCNVPILPR